MKREVRLSKRAMKRLDKLLVFLEKEWSIKVKNDFIKKLDRSLKQLQEHPTSFPESEKRQKRIFTKLLQNESGIEIGCQHIAQRRFPGSDISLNNNKIVVICHSGTKVYIFFLMQQFLK